MRRYTDDFKHDAVQYLKDHPGIPLEQVANDLGIPGGTLYGWVKAERRKQQNTNVNPSAPLTEAEKEMNRMAREIRDLRDALEILKKAISILND